MGRLLGGAPCSGVPGGNRACGWAERVECTSLPHNCLHCTAMLRTRPLQKKLLCFPLTLPGHLVAQHVQQAGTGGCTAAHQCMQCHQVLLDGAAAGHVQPGGAVGQRLQVRHQPASSTEAGGAGRWTGRCSCRQLSSSAPFHKDCCPACITNTVPSAASPPDGLLQKGEQGHRMRPGREGPVGSCRLARRGRVAQPAIPGICTQLARGRHACRRGRQVLRCAGLLLIRCDSRCLEAWQATHRADSAAAGRRAIHSAPHA